LAAKALTDNTAAFSDSPRRAGLLFYEPFECAQGREFHLIIGNLKRDVMFSLLSGITFALPSAQALEVFSQGMEVPETISRIPSHFGTLAGDYLVPDFGFGQSSAGEAETLWRVPGEGGDPIDFATLDFAPRGGLFLPDSFGAFGGQYLVVGEEARGDNRFDGRMLAFDAQANPTDFARLAEFDSLTTPIMAPTGFGNLGGRLIVTNQLSGVLSADTAANVTEFFDALEYRNDTGLDVMPFGAAFAPDGFGEHGGKLFVTDGRTTPSEAMLHVLAIDSTGQAQLFTSIELAAEQAAIDAGLRQLAFVPQGYGALSGQMLLAVSGSLNGGGVLGQLLVLNDRGETLGHLRLDRGIDKFDPRGVLFRDDGSILISDGSDPILIARPGDFTLPEPATLSLSCAGIAIVLTKRRRA